MSRVLSVVVAALASFASGTGVLSAADLAAPSIAWNRSIAQPPADADSCLRVSGVFESRGVAIGPDQNPVFAAEVTNGSLTTIVVAKYERATGERLWCTSFPVRAIGSSKLSFTVAFAHVGGVAIDPAGTIFIAGDGATTPYPSPLPTAPSSAASAPVNRYFVTKCSATGVCEQAVTFVNPALSGVHTDRIGDIAAGSDGNLVLTGLASVTAAGRPTVFKVLTVKVSGLTLGILGQAQVDSNPPGAASRQSVIIDASNNVLFTATTASTWKYDSRLLRPIWNSRVAGARITVGPDVRTPADHRRRNADAADDDTSAVVVVGADLNRATGRQDLAVTELDGATGSAVWTARYDSGFDSVVRGVAIDPYGNVLIAGDRSGRNGRTGSLFVRSELVGFNPAGQATWVALFAPGSRDDDTTQYSAAGVVVDEDGDAVVAATSAGPQDNWRGSGHIIRYGYRRRSAGGDDRHHRHDNDDDDDDDDADHGALRWDQNAGDTVTGFVVCVDGQSRPMCQDVGKPAGRRIRSTTPGSLTYQIALARLHSLREGRHRVDVIAYNRNGDGPRSVSLLVEIERDDDSKDRGHHGGDWNDGKDRKDKHD